MLKQSVAIILLLITLSINIISCAESSVISGQPDDSLTTLGEEAVQEETNRGDIKDNVPALDFEGREFRVIYHDSQYQKMDIVAETLNGDIINDAVYHRNMAVEERLGVKILPIAGGAGSTGVIDIVKPSIVSASDDYDLVVSHALRTAALVPEGLFTDWYSILHIELNQPWWIDRAVEQLTVGNRAYLMVGDYALITIGGTYCMYFNKELGANNNIDPNDMYAVVLEGNWTYNKMFDTVKDLAYDIDGDGTMTDTDQYGLFTTTNSPAVTYLWAFDAPLTTRDADNMPELSLNQTKWSSIVDMVYNLYYENPGTYSTKDQESVFLMFRNGNIFLLNANFQTSISFRDLEFEYGIIPYPKFDNNQENYLTMVDGFHTLFAVPVTSRDLSFVGAVTELLNAESYRQVVPLYYETALKVKYARDNESVQIMDMILSGRTFDFGYFYDNWTGFAFMLQTLMQNKDNNFASYYAAQETKAVRQFESVMEAYLTLE